MNLTTQPYKSWTDLQISLSAEDISKIESGTKIRLLIRPNGDGYLIAGPELITELPGIPQAVQPVPPRLHIGGAVKSPVF